MAEVYALGQLLRQVNGVRLPLMHTQRLAVSNAQRLPLLHVMDQGRQILYRRLHGQQRAQRRVQLTIVRRRFGRHIAQLDQRLLQVQTGHVQLLVTRRKILETHVCLLLPLPLRDTATSHHSL